MTERQLYEECIPQIAEIIIEARKMTAKEYYEWKTDVIQNSHKKTKDFMNKIFLVIEKYLPEID